MQDINADKTPENEATPTEQDFPHLPTVRPTVRTQGVAMGTKTPAKTLPNLLKQDQNQIINKTAQAVEAQVKELLPQILAKIMEALTTI